MPLSVRENISLPTLRQRTRFGLIAYRRWQPGIHGRPAGLPAGLYTVRRSLKTAKFLVYQDNPGNGQQAPIFRRFYWWEDECTRRMTEKFGITLEKRSFKELGDRAKNKSDAEAIQARKEWGDSLIKGYRNVR